MKIEFPHTAPKDYSYEQVQFKSNVVAVWILHHRQFSYNSGSPVRCIWGFYNTKTKCFHSPINSKTVGNQVNIEDTSPYSAMIPKLSPLEKAFL